MIAGERFVYYGPEPWQSMWRNRHQLLSRLAAANQVVYIEPRPYLEEVLAELRQTGAGAAQILRGRRLEQERPNLWVYHPPHFAPLGGPAPARAVFHALRRATLRRDLAAIGIDARRPPIVWLSTPTQYDARLDLPARLRIYHIVDDYLGYYDLPASHRASFAQREANLIAWADRVIAVSPELLASKGAGNPKFRLLPNGFDAAAYAPGRAHPRPPALAQLPRPILGYIGLISVRLDLALLDQLAAGHPAWSFVLLGSVIPHGCADALARLASRPNVHLLPPVPPGQVADYVCAFDVGLAPYRVTQETIHASPLKIYEYLAAGLPVVAADVPGARQFAGPVVIASPDAASGPDWATAIRAALAADSPDQRAARRAAVAPHTWDARVETLSDLLAEALAAAGG